MRALQATVPAAVDEAIRKAMAPAPADRFATVAEFARALRGSMPLRPHRRLPAAAAALAAGLAIAAAALFAWRRMDAGGARSDAGTRVVTVLPKTSAEAAQ